MSRSERRKSAFRIVSQRYEEVEVDSIRPHPENPRKGNVEVIEESISANGFYGACVVQASSRYILAGAHRWKAAKARGAKTLPVLLVEVDDATARRIVLADNRANDLAGYDDAALAAALRAAQDDGGLYGTGFDDDAAVAAGIERATNEEADATDKEPEEEGPYRTAVGEFWELGDHTLFVGDSTVQANVDALLAGSQPKLQIVDPPYDLEYAAWFTPPSVDVFAVWFRSKDAMLWMAEKFSGPEWGVHGLVFTGGVRGQMRPSLPCCMHDNVYIWRRKWWTEERDAIDGATIRASGCRATKDDRPISWQEHVGGVLTGAEGMSWGKPVLENALAMAYVPRGSVVYDPCAGSGTSLLAAEMHGRIAKCSELLPKWADLILRRWERLTGKTATRRAP